MSHLDADVAALLALGERIAPEDLAHAESCEHCRSEVHAFQRAVVAGRAASSDTLLAPPAHVWDSIARELSFEHPPAGGADAAPAAGHHVARGSGRRLRRRPMFLALGAVAAAAVIVVGVWASGGIVPRADVVSEATLDGFPEWQGANGEAALERVDGHTQVVVRLDASVPDDGYREVWLLTADASDLVSLGILEGEDGVFPVPDDVDLDAFTVVDISQESADGDPGHSGDSIVRGALSSR